MSKKSKKQERSNSAKKYKVQKLLELAMEFHSRQNIKLAENAYRKVIDLDPLNYRALYLLGILAAEVNSFKAAIGFLKLAIEVNPNYSLAYNDLGVVLQQIGNPKAAMKCYTKALELNRSFSEAQNNMGVALQSRGNAKKAQEYFKTAMSINPFYFDASNNYIFALDLSEDETVESLIQARKDWSKIHEEPLLSKQKPHNNELTTDRKLRIGYVSADFRLHSASFVFGGMLTEYNRDKFEVYAYNNYTTNSNPDDRTLIFKQSVTQWRDIFSLKDEEVTDLIRKDKIDILVDLSGYSSGTRLLVFARKPAPVQVTAWGYATSTGMKSIDYFFADEIIVPPEEKDLYVENIAYLPNVVTHYCPESKPDVAELPAIKKGYITFGSFNRLCKITDETFDLWGRVLTAVPNSKMMLKISELGDVTTQEWAIENFAKVGIDKDRLIFMGRTPWYAHMATFNNIDIALDPFPHGGGITTLEGLQMGVPVVSLKWPSIVGRLSSTILNALTMNDWVATSKEEYVNIAVEKTRDLDSLNSLRLNLRSKMKSSIIGDYSAYCREVESKYVEMWETYVATKTS